MLEHFEANSNYLEELTLVVNIADTTCLRAVFALLIRLSNAFDALSFLSTGVNPLLSTVIASSGSLLVNKRLSNVECLLGRVYWIALARNLCRIFLAIASGLRMSRSSEDKVVDILQARYYIRTVRTSLEAFDLLTIFSLPVTAARDDDNDIVVMNVAVVVVAVVVVVVVVVVVCLVMKKEREEGQKVRRGLEEKKRKEGGG